jgi:Uma2 family endonuclease
MPSNSATVTKKRFTYEDYAKLPEGAPCQLIGGDLVMSPSPSPHHQIILSRLFLQIALFVNSRKLGLVLVAPLDVYLSDAETYQPDILFISNDQKNIVGEQKIEGAPDLVVEILSPSTAYYDLKHKMKRYEAFGVKEYWIVDPAEESIEVYQSFDGQFRVVSQAQRQGLVKSALLAGFEMTLIDLFN